MPVPYKLVIIICIICYTYDHCVVLYHICILEINYVFCILYSVLEKEAIRAAGVSSEMIPTRSSAGRRKPVDRSGLVGPQNRTDQPVLTGSEEDQVGTVPTGPVGPDIIIDRIQPVAEGPVGQFSAYSPVGPDHCITSDSDQPTADGPVGVHHTQPSGTRPRYNE